MLLNELGEQGMTKIIMRVAPLMLVTAFVAASDAKPDSFDTKPDSFDTLMAQGKQIYQTNCAACHHQEGTGLGKVFPPLKGSPVTSGAIEKHIDIVLWGVPKTAMSAWASQLTDQQIAALVTYERNAWGNNVGDKADAAMVAKLRAKALR